MCDSGWDLKLTLADARKNEELISLASSQLLRWIDELNGVSDADSRAKEIKRKIRQLKSEPNSVANKHRIKALYGQLDDLQFKADYINIIIDKPKHYRRLCKGFKINGRKYVRLFSTVGGVKNSTVVFVSEALAPELRRRANNGRDPTKTFAPAKLQAYLSLVCSGSVPVSMPRGVAVVSDVETTFNCDAIYLDSSGDGEPTMECRDNEEITIDATDGFGLMLPALAERWSDELGLNYTASAMCTRQAFEKGMVFTFDFREFAETHDKYIATDVWGNKFDVRNVELILTESMLKLWSSYENIDKYFENCEANKFTFGITKVAPKVLDSERALNYQFIQSYKLSDEDIYKLVAPTVQMLDDVLDRDWRKAVLFLKGSGLTLDNIDYVTDNYIKAIMVEPELFNDPYVRSMIYDLIKNRITEAKVGVLNVHGNYSIASGDPVLLCQNMLGLPATGVLKAGEVYNEYWANTEADKLVCFRAPMSCHNNIRKVTPCRRDDVRYWLRYMNTCTVFSAWSPEMIALNGMDFDGDLVFLTDNEVLVHKHRELPPLVCAQRNAEKIIPKEEDFVKSDLNTFGNDIGRITNYITSMYEVQSKFPEGSEEYNELEYRIQSGQQKQQDAIDKSKGIISKPMPKEWYDWNEANAISNPVKRRLYRSIVADRKPYFMKYIYPPLKKKYNTYIRNSEKNAIREFGISLSELQSTAYKDLSEEQKEFMRYYEFGMPVGDGDCCMNRICHLIENRYDGFIGRYSEKTAFDYSILKGGSEYSAAHYNAIYKLVLEYNKYLQERVISLDYERSGEHDANKRDIIKQWFIRMCNCVCPNEDCLCDILLDICYQRVRNKRLVWDVCSATIVKNLLKRNQGVISFPVQDPNGDILYGGRMFKEEHKRLEGYDGDCS